MKEVLSSDESFLNCGSKEYLNYPSLILREVKGCKLLSAGAKHCWELLYDLSKFDAKRFIDISIKKIKSILSDSKSYRTIQRYLAQLAEHNFIMIKKNFDSYGRIENTYSIKVPTSITNKLNESTTKVFIKSSNPVSNPVNPRYDSFVQGNKELNIINNNCYHLEKDEKEDLSDELVSNSSSTEINSDVEVLEYYPAKEKPSSPSKAVLRHALSKGVKFEAVLSTELSQSQENVIRQIIGFWTALRFVSSPKECFEWIKAVLLNPKALSGCGNNFLKKMNVIFKMIREKRFSRPFKQRYEQKMNPDKTTSQPRKVEEPLKAEVDLLSFMNVPHTPSRKTYQEQEKARMVEAYEQQISSVQKKLKGTAPENIKPLYDLIDSLKLKIQDVYGAQFEMN